MDRVLNPLLNRLKQFAPWTAVFEDDRVVTEAAAEIARLYPLDPERRDLLRRLDRDLARLEQDPAGFIQDEPLRTDVAGVYRCPADEQVPVGLVLEVIESSRQVKLVAVHIRRPLLKRKSHEQHHPDQGQARAKRGSGKDR